MGRETGIVVGFSYLCFCDPAEGSLSWGRLSRERDRAAERPEVGFGSRDSDQVVEYLQKIQSIQLKLLCYRVRQLSSSLLP